MGQRTSSVIKATYRCQEVNTQHMGDKTTINLSQVTDVKTRLVASGNVQKEKVTEDKNQKCAFLQKNKKNKPTFGSVTSSTLDVIFVGRIGIKLFKKYILLE